VVPTGQDVRQRALTDRCLLKALFGLWPVAGSDPKLHPMITALRAVFADCRHGAQCISVVFSSLFLLSLFFVFFSSLSLSRFAYVRMVILKLLSCIPDSPLMWRVDCTFNDFMKLIPKWMHIYKIVD